MSSFSKILLLMLLLYIIFNKSHCINSLQEQNFWFRKKIKLLLNDCNKIKKITGKSYESLGKEAAQSLQGVYIRLVTSTAMIKFDSNYTSVALRNSPFYNINYRHVIYFHGFSASENDTEVFQFANDIVELGSVNMIIVQAQSMLSSDYYTSSSNARYLAEAVASFLADLRSHGATDFHLVGTSLGAQVCGLAGKLYKKLTGFNIKRISALDPTGPCFYKEPLDKRLTDTDADFVDVIHTDVNYFGHPGPNGHVDFYPNGGNDMPGCFDRGCTHNAAYRYYFESVKNNKFLSVICSDYNTFTSGIGCSTNPHVTMGYWLTSSTTSGSYFLKTAPNSPYALGLNGLI